mgnify:FL=1
MNSQLYRVFFLFFIFILSACSERLSVAPGLQKRRIIWTPFHYNYRTLAIIDITGQGLARLISDKISDLDSDKWLKKIRIYFNRIYGVDAVLLIRKITHYFTKSSRSRHSDGQITFYDRGYRRDLYIGRRNIVTYEHNVYIIAHISLKNRSGANIYTHIIKANSSYDTSDRNEDPDKLRMYQVAKNNLAKKIAELITPQRSYQAILINYAEACEGYYNAIIKGNFGAEFQYSESGLHRRILQRKNGLRFTALELYLQKDDPYAAESIVKKGCPVVASHRYGKTPLRLAYERLLFWKNDRRNFSYVRRNLIKAYEKLIITLKNLGAHY